MRSFSQLMRATWNKSIGITQLLKNASMHILNTPENQSHGNVAVTMMLRRCEYGVWGSSV